MSANAGTRLRSRSSTLTSSTSSNAASNTYHAAMSGLSDSSRNRIRLSVNIPKPSPALLEQFSYMPGHFMVMEVLSEPSLNLFTVKLGSKEIERISLERLKTLNNGTSALKAYRAALTKAAVYGQTIDADGSDKTSSAYTMVDSSSELTTLKRVKKRKLSFRFPYSEGASRGSKRNRRSSAPRQATDNGSAPLASSSESDNSAHQGFFREQSRGSRGMSKAGRDKSTAVRRSSRIERSATKTMREPLEDEISSASEDETVGKIAAVKEHFVRLPYDDTFRKIHTSYCDSCGHVGKDPDKGHLVFCQGCTTSYHQGCLGPRASRKHLVTKISDANFVLQCRYCISHAQSADRLIPDLGMCTSCHKPGELSRPLQPRLTMQQEQQLREQNSGINLVTAVADELINNAVNVMYRCHRCRRAWHMQHSYSFEAKPQPCSSDDCHEARIMSYSHIANKDSRTDYNVQQCPDCSQHPSSIDAIIAWRPSGSSDHTEHSAIDTVPEAEREYLIKWHNQSYLKLDWMPGCWVWTIAAPAMKKAFGRKEENHYPKLKINDAVPESYTTIEIIFDVQFSAAERHTSQEAVLKNIDQVDKIYVKFKGLGYEAAIWEKPPSKTDHSRWNSFKSAYEDYAKKFSTSIPPQGVLQQHLRSIRKDKFSRIERQKQPETMTGGELMPYQLEGLNWLYWKWFRGQNGILADDMGLGKTIQVIGFLTTLFSDHSCWPFLVVAPTSTIPNWRREIKKWSPSLRVVDYYGSKLARKLACEYELFPEPMGEVSLTPGGKKPRQAQAKDITAHVVISSYESINDDSTRQKLHRVPWQVLVVDEGQRLKNDVTQTYEALSSLQVPCRLLLTGTPLQNNVRELLNLLQFLDNNVAACELEKKYGELNDETIHDLHGRLKPILLRRTKSQVLPDLLPLTEIIIPLTMSHLQKKLYKSILAQNPQLLKAISAHSGKLGTKDRYNLNNIVMQLRKTLCHPFVFNAGIEEQTDNTETAFRGLVEASAKLQLLQIMLPQLEKRGTRVLLFSQFLDNLDIMEEFLEGLGLSFLRLDGSVDTLERQKRIDTFNEPKSSIFAFLLSTRASGVGINLATADTVIIMDPDYNPHQDLQAISRAHRIGQAKKVLVFRLMVKGTAEEKIFAIAKAKLALDHVLIKGIDNADGDDMNFESILRFGAAALFEDQPDDHGITYDNAAVEKLLDRSQIEVSDQPSDNSQFTYARVWANDTSTLENNDLAAAEDDPATSSFWDTVLQAREKAHQKDLVISNEILGRGKRNRHLIDYSLNQASVQIADDAEAMESEQISDAIYEGGSNESSTEEEIIPTSLTYNDEQPLASQCAPMFTCATRLTPRSLPSVDRPHGMTDQYIPQLQHTSQADLPGQVLPWQTLHSQRDVPLHIIQSQGTPWQILPWQVPPAPSLPGVPPQSVPAQSFAPQHVLAQSSPSQSVSYQFLAASQDDYTQASSRLCHTCGVEHFFSNFVCPLQRQ